MASAIESVVNFLTKRRETHNGPDLLDRYLRHGCNMETQVNVSPGKGERVPGTKSTYTSEDGLERWFSYRIPKHADTKPEFRDYELGYALDLHCEGIGSTGWDWVNKVSRWAGYDFDALVGHAAGIGISTERLAEVQEAAKSLPYVTARLSTGGGGLHLDVELPEIETLNHTEHAALARCVLGVMSRDAGFDFSAQIDACGGNMWLWHRKSTPTNLGLKLLKPAERMFDIRDLPANWRDHLDVIKRRRTKVRVYGISSEDEDPFDLLASAHRRVPLDSTHKAIIEELTKTGATVTWIADHHLLQTHTKAFEKLMIGMEACDNCKGTGIEQNPNLEQFEVEFGTELKPQRCHACKGEKVTKIAERLNLKGIFETNSRGSNLGEPNCFAFPGDRGSWKVYRFSPGISEAKTWNCDGRGWTTCWFNSTPDLKSVSLASGGKELDNGGFEFENLDKAAQAARLLNPSVEFPLDDVLRNRTTVMKPSKDGRLAIQVQKKSDDPTSIGDWNNSDKKSAWTQILNIQAEPATKSVLNVNVYDNSIRCLETIDGKPANWAALKADGQWTRKNASAIKTILQRHGHKKPEAEEIMGYAEERPWKLVMIPFAPEYPGDRKWNKNAPQLKYQPLTREEFEALGDNPHPYWDRLLTHVGGDLTKHLRELEWAQQSGIKTGADYLTAIFASIIREPFEHTPYLFLFGPQNSGKTILHDAFSVLVTKGVVEADRALTSQNDFNGELAEAILCFVEEKDISKSPGAYAKIKNAVTAEQMAIHKKGMEPYMAPNTTHWMHCANSHENMPLSSGDLRVTMIYVPRPETDIPKRYFLEKLTEEAPAFLRTLLDFDLPPLIGRLRIPVVETEHKRRAEYFSKTSLQTFIDENVHSCPGSLIPFAEFYQKFIEACPPEEKGVWTRIKVSKSLPMEFQTGAGSCNKVSIINASWENSEPQGPPYIIVGGKIRRLE